MRCMLIVAGRAIVLSSIASAQEIQNLRAPADSPTPTVRILAPKAGAALKANSEFTVRIETDNFEFAYDHAATPGGPDRLPAQYNQVTQRPNSGHVHVY